MSKKGIKMKDIANMLGVSTVTVSKALADKDGVSEELKKKIKETARELGYRNRDSMRSGSATNTVGILVADHFVASGQSFYWDIYQSIVNSLRPRGYYAMLEMISVKDEQEGNIPAFVREEKVDIIFVLGWLGRTYLRALDAAGLPLLYVDFYSKANRATAVIADMLYDTYQMTEYLYSIGHRRIGFVGSIHATSDIEDRYLGYYKSVIRRRLPYQEDWVLEDRDEVSGTVPKRVFQLPENMPTAFVCNNDETAYYFIHYLESQGFRVPEDVSVTGFYDNKFATAGTPAITTIRVDAHRIAESAVNAGLRLMWGSESLPDMVLVRGEMVMRDSVQSLETGEGN